MPKYTYVSRDAQGQKVTAIAEAESRQQLLNQLKDRGLTVVDITEHKESGKAVPKRNGAHRPRIVSGRISTGELALFWRELATMLVAGLPIVEALESIGEELEHVRLRIVLKDVVAQMWKGSTFAQGLQRHPKVFSPMVVSLIHAAEESGSLPQIANQLATYLENRDRIIGKVRAALTYPIFLCGFFLLVIFVATFWIIPKFREIYQGFGAKLPWITQMVFAINQFMLDNFLWIAIGTVLFVMLMAIWISQPSGRAVIDRIGLKVPIFGPLLQRAAVARLCRSLAVLLEGGIPINRALEMAQYTSGNSVVAKAVAKSREEILKGNKIAASFKKHPVFPQMTIRMITTGEETGSLHSLLERVAEFYESRVDAALTGINALIEPIMISVVGAGVLIFVLSMYMPIFKLAATMRG